MDNKIIDSTQQPQKVIKEKLGFRWVNTQSIRSRLILAFVGAVLFTAVIISLSSIIINFETSQQQVVDELEAIASLKTADIDVWIDNLRDDLAGLTGQDEPLVRMRTLLQPTAFRALISSELRGNFEQVLELSERFDEIFLVNLEGEVLVSTNVEQEGQSYSGESFFQEGLREPFLQAPIYSPTQNKISMFVSQPIFHQKGQTLGVLVGRVNLERLDEIIRQQSNFSEASRPYLVDANKRLIISPFSEYKPGEISVQSDGVLAALEGNDGSGTYSDYRGTPVIGVYQWLPDLQVVLLSEQDQADALRPIFAIIAINVIIASIAAGAAVFIGVLITRSIADPLKALADTSTKIAAGDLSLTARVVRKDEIGNVAQAFNQMTERLSSLINTLEERVGERTRALETAAEISLQITSILDKETLLDYVVQRIQTEFDFYHTHIYLLDPETKELVMASGSGEVGQKLKARGHRLQIGQGIVGRVAQTGQPLISEDVTQSSIFVRNDLLSNTQSELAVPLLKGEQLLGVLDIQSEQLDRFTGEDLSLMQSVANQLATALDNARLLANTQEALREVGRLNRRLTRQGWEEVKEESQVSGYRFHVHDNLIIPDNETLLPPMRQAATQKQLVKQTLQANGNAQAELAVPLVLRGEVIGVLGVKREEKPTWSEEEVSAVETVANQIALALENARLSQEQGKTIEKLQEVDRLKSEFLTSMSHELRTPLNSIIGFADVLIQGIDGELNDLALHDIQLIYNSGQHLLAIINDILDLSKIEAGKMELVCEPLTMKPVVNEVLAATQSLFKDKSIEMVIDVPEVLPPIYADKLRLNQILLNLVSNAAKFTSEGQITIQANVSDEEPDKMFISVTDTGIGIPEKKQRTIFDRFSQADSSTTRQYGGTGLGLPICLQLVHMHGGKIGVRSKEGQGSTFFFTIPLATEITEDIKN